MIERRAFTLEIRADKSEGRKVSGYAAMFDSASERLWGDWVEVIKPGAFARSLGDTKADIFMLWQHDAAQPIASVRAGSLTLSEDSTGLAFEAAFGESEQERYWHSKVADGTIRSMSFGFITRKDEWDHEKMVRTLLDVDLLDVSPVTWPAYQDTSISARAQDFESLLKANPAPTRAYEGFPLSLQLRLRGRRSARQALGEPPHGNQRKTAEAG